MRCHGRAGIPRCRTSPRPAAPAHPRFPFSSPRPSSLPHAHISFCLVSGALAGRAASRSAPRLPSRRRGSPLHPIRHPGLRAGVHPWLSMPPQPVESKLNRWGLPRTPIRGCRQDRGWAPARGPGRRLGADQSLGPAWARRARGPLQSVMNCHAVSWAGGNSMLANQSSPSSQSPSRPSSSSSPSGSRSRKASSSRSIRLCLRCSTSSGDQGS